MAEQATRLLNSYMNSNYGSMVKEKRKTIINKGFGGHSNYRICSREFHRMLKKRYTDSFTTNGILY